MDLGLLGKLGGWVARFHTSLYADDAAIFLKRMTMDVSNLMQLLTNFGQVTGLQTNLQKTSVAPISCSNFDIDEILADLPVNRTGFPMKYLGLPLAIRRLQKIEFQPPMDRAASKLSCWQGRNLTQAGCVSLTKSVLSS